MRGTSRCSRSGRGEREKGRGRWGSLHLTSVLPSFWFLYKIICSENHRGVPIVHKVWLIKCPEPNSPSSVFQQWTYLLFTCTSSSIRWLGRSANTMQHNEFLAKLFGSCLFLMRRLSWTHKQQLNWYVHQKFINSKSQNLDIQGFHWAGRVWKTVIWNVTENQSSKINVCEWKTQYLPLKSDGVEE